MTDTQQLAADVVQEAARQHRIAIYVESTNSGGVRIISADGNYADYAEMLYKAADTCAEHATRPLPVRRLRD